jgi:hypothetical protein
MSKPNSKQLLIEKELLGELPAEAKASLPTDREEQLANLRRDNEEILGKYPAARVAKEISRRLAKEEEKEPQRRWAMILLPAAAVPLVLAAVLWGPRGPLGSGQTAPVGDDSTTIGDDSDVQLKGQAAHLRIYRRRDGAAPERLQDGSIVHPGEVIQLAYLPAGRGFGVIVSLDGSGNVELHHPAAADSPPVLARGGEQPLGRGYKLDEAPRFERFFFITAKSRESLQVAQVLQAVRSLSTQPDADRAPLSLHGQVEIHSLTLRKEGP